MCRRIKRRSGEGRRGEGDAIANVLTFIHKIKSAFQFMHHQTNFLDQQLLSSNDEIITEKHLSFK